MFRMDGSKRCNKCGESKPLSDFSKDRSARDGRQGRCKPCAKAAHKEYYEANAENIRARTRRHYESNREKRVEYSRQYRRENAETIARNNAEWRSRNPDYFRQKAREWRALHPGAAEEQRNERRARKAKAPSDGTNPTWQKVARRDGMECAYCGVVTVPKHDDRRLWPTLDHIVPLSRGGADSMGNAVLACFSCNSRKGAN
jgi:5-methylcytosine-specific restriction endonuclease McrA